MEQRGCFSSCLRRGAGGVLMPLVVSILLLLVHTSSCQDAGIVLDSIGDDAWAGRSLLQAPDTSGRVALFVSSPEGHQSPPFFLVCGPPLAFLTLVCQGIVKQYTSLFHTQCYSLFGGQQVVPGSYGANKVALHPTPCFLRVCCAA